MDWNCKGNQGTAGDPRKGSGTGNLPETIVRIVTVLEVAGVGDDGGLRKPNLAFDSMICRSVSSDGPTWYLDCEEETSA